jgi:hypothetical protein
VGRQTHNTSPETREGQGPHVTDNVRFHRGAGALGGWPSSLGMRRRRSILLSEEKILSNGHQIDGALASWADVESLCKWDALLLGNGLSINVWRDFGYASLYKRARESKLIPPEIRRLFEALETENFEIVLNALSTSMVVAEAMEDPAIQRLHGQYVAVRAAMGKAIRAVHLERGEMPTEALRIIKAQMSSHRVTFSTSYDLIVYWSMGYPDDYGDLVDRLWGGRLHADEKLWPGKRPVYFLHGALHLVTNAAGITRKLRKDHRTLLEMFGELSGNERPLLISEGSSAEKVRAIAENDYLSFALSELQECDAPLVVFGSSLGESDQHLVDAITRHPTRPVAVSLMKSTSASRIVEDKGRLKAKFPDAPLFFFDAQTHPLGGSGLTNRESLFPTWLRPSVRRRLKAARQSDHAPPDPKELGQVSGPRAVRPTPRFPAGGPGRGPTPPRQTPPRGAPERYLPSTPV